MNSSSQGNAFSALKISLMKAKDIKYGFIYSKLVVVTK
jgi:hypothetical protein